MEVLESFHVRYTSFATDVVGFKVEFTCVTVSMN